MGFLDLFSAASMPVLKLLLVTAIGLFLALDRIDILGESSRKHVNKITFFVFNPALVGSNLARTITLKSIRNLWFMPINVLLTFVIGSALGWILVKITRPPPHQKGVVIATCATGNVGYILLIIIPAVCREKGSPFGDPDVCHKYGLAYASFSLALGAVLAWTYVYNIVRVCSRKPKETVCIDDPIINIESITEKAEQSQENLTDMTLPTKGFSSTDNVYGLTDQTSDDAKEYVKVTIWYKIKKHFGNFSRQVNIKAVLAPSTIGAIIGLAIGAVTPVRKLLIGGTAPLRVIGDSASFLGDASIPTVTLIMGGNLLRGLKGSGIQLSLVIGIIAVRYLFLPVLGVMIVKGAIKFGLVHSDPLYQFILLLQFALPPAMNLGTMTQLFGAGESECSVIMLWTYCLASISLTVWSTFFMWLVS